MAKQKRVEEEYIPQFRHTLLHAHQLLCYFLGSKKIAQMAGEKGFIWLGLMQKMHERIEVRHLLVNIATNIRIGRDYQRVHYSANKDLSKAEVGKLVEARKRKLLILSEACNKIIHATKFTFEKGETQAQGNSYSGTLKLPYLKPFLHLYGTRWDKSRGKNVHWKATVDVEAFAKHAAVASVGYMWQFKEKD
jgi:hypothetical protein